MKPVVLLAFANCAQAHLHLLKHESAQLNKLMSPLHDKGIIEVFREESTTVDELAGMLNRFDQRICIFHYAGHAGGKTLQLEEGNAHAHGLAGLFKQQADKLAFVFLNGCSTRGQVDRLLQLGIKAVIATSVPIADRMAVDFAAFFYQALGMRRTLKDAFDFAAASIQTKYREVEKAPKVIFRSIFLDAEDLKDDELPWGLYVNETYEDILNWRIPIGVQQKVATDFEPNQLLIETIWDALAEEGMVTAGRKKLKLSKKRMDILNNFPAPIAEHLRKLFVPLGDANEGYNKIGISRLKQLARTYQVLMELLTFTLLAQLWEHQLQGNAKELKAALADAIKLFLDLSEEDRESFRLIPFIQKLQQALDIRKLDYFVEELADLSTLTATATPFQQACLYFDFLREQIQKDEALLHAEVGTQCVEAETHLATIFQELSYLAEYTLATVKQILVKKQRHSLKPRFQHVVVRLVDLLGGMDEEEETFLGYLDSQSVLLLKEEEDENSIPFLNLSPFIIDENAFVDNSDVSKIYFYHHYQSRDNAWAYRWVHKPNDPVLLVPGKEFEEIKEQMEAFRSGL